MFAADLELKSAANKLGSKRKEQNPKYHSEQKERSKISHVQSARSAPHAAGGTGPCRHCSPLKP